MNGARSVYARAWRRGARLAPGLAGSLLALLIACVPPGTVSEEQAVPVLQAMPEIADSVEGAGLPVHHPEREIAQPEDTGGGSILSGRLDGEGDYDLYEFGASQAGDRWMVERQPVLGGGFVVVALFDANLHLLARSNSADSAPLMHVFRRDSSQVFIGLAASCHGAGGAYRFRVSRARGAEIPPPRAQLVWLNFHGAAGVNVATYHGLSFGAFDSAMIGAAYRAAAAEIRQAIVDTIDRNYADYDLTVLSSEKSPEPDEPHAVVHFGGWSATQLGAADEVDPYNRDPEGSAIVFVESFRTYGTMGLTPTELGRMIGNTASHELGHLLGLYHVYKGTDLMVESRACSAAEMAGQQCFGVAGLDPCVFPAGSQDAALLLEDAVGLHAELTPTGAR